MTDIQKLSTKLNSISYPDTMIPINREIKGRAFFPGGNGTFNGEENISNKSVMFLGQDFDCQKNFDKTLLIGHEDIEKNPTWRNILSYLSELEVSPANCFFTNSIAGIRKGDLGTGKSPAFKNKEFIESCRTFFLYQIEIQKPKIIFALGKYVGEFLSPTSDDLKFWNRITNFSTIDEHDKQKITATFKNGITSEVILLTHPSYRQANIHRRKYLNYTGNEAEIMMAKDLI